MSINTSSQNNNTQTRLRDSNPTQGQLPIHQRLPVAIMNRIFSFETEFENACTPCVSKAWKEITFPSIIRREWLFKGSQENCSGPVIVSEAESVRARLNSKSPLGIRFNPSKISDNIEGGTCSAMAYEFLCDYFNARKITNNQSHPQTDALLHQLSGFATKFSTSSEEFRNRQAAFNTIEIRDRHKLRDSSVKSWTPFYSKNKVQSLANYHSLQVNYCSNEIDVEHASKEDVSRELSALPEGAYLLRALKPDTNEKLEDFGHSMIYIKEKDFTLFYDPNFGLENLTPSKHSEAVFEGLKLYLALGVNTARFYRLEPK